MNVYEKAVELWGVEAQLLMVMEECAELIQACSKYWRRQNKETMKAVIEEAVDVDIMINQLKEILPYHSIWRETSQDKILRLTHQIQDWENRSSLSKSSKCARENSTFSSTDT